jgi:hypothetical protein
VPLETRLLEHRFPYECRTQHSYKIVSPWCREQFGEFNDRWYRYGTDIALNIASGTVSYDYYRFRDEQAAVLFRLKWS